MERREFLRRMTMGLAAGWAGGKISWPVSGLAAAPELRLAFLADAHLPDGHDGRPEARALARAVQELRALQPPPQLVLFAGDLAHKGNPHALALGKEILSDLPAPCRLVPGEGDGLPDGAAAWRRLFGESWFSKSLPGLQVIGLHTVWCPGPAGPLFRVGETSRRRLARELARVDPEIPLLILSHAPLAPVYHPWQQWTLGGAELLSLLTAFPKVMCLHGHTHNAGVRGQGLGVSKAVISDQWSVISKGKDMSFTEKRKPKTENPLHLALPATAWPGPLAIQGTPAHLRPGLGPACCGWGVVYLRNDAWEFRPHLWQA